MSKAIAVGLWILATIAAVVLVWAILRPILTALFSGTTIPTF